MRFRPLLLSVILLFSCVGGAEAVIDLLITRPTTDFTTSNQTLQIEGIVESSAPAQVIVSTNTPAGLRDLAQLAHSIYAVVVDLGSVQELRGVLIRAVTDNEFPLGPRLIRIAFSPDSSSFSAGQHLNVPSSIDPAFQRTVVDLPSLVSARFIQIEMLEGWQTERIAIESIEFLDTSNQIIQARIQEISIRLDLTEQRRATFAIEVLLEAGENRLSLLARELSPSVPDSPATVDGETISLVYLPELRPEAASDGHFILSDGGQATIIIPVDAFDERIKQLQFFSIPPAQVDSLSYLRNTRIVKGTTPVVVYRFEALRQSGFSAEASSSLSNQPPTLAVDGILEPPSTWMAGIVPVPISLTIDLDVPHTVSRIVLHPNVEDNRIFGPQRAKISVSNDNENFTEILEFTAFEEAPTIIELPTQPSGRYFRLDITEIKEADDGTQLNIQLNEVEFFDTSDVQIVSFDTFEHFPLQQPMLLEFSYQDSDLVAANVTREADLKIFVWDALAQEWQLAGGEIDLNRRVVRLELNYIAQVALFQAVPTQIQAAWSFNPFSPDGNGIADITRLTIVNPDTSQIGQTELIVEIFDLRNKRIRTLINRIVVNANAVSVEWDGRDRTGEIVNIGPYIYQIQLGSEIRNGVIVVGK
ncbi:MAG: discoidin domain-containing protein [Candidatus Poribacteria bacterium]|nr:discoidin domain-containing protein [Candidatus Poribacteria bacterium]